MSEDSKNNIGLINAEMPEFIDKASSVLMLLSNANDTAVLLVHLILEISVVLSQLILKKVFLLPLAHFQKPTTSRVEWIRTKIVITNFTIRCTELQHIDDVGGRGGT